MNSIMYKMIDVRILYKLSRTILIYMFVLQFIEK